MKYIKLWMCFMLAAMIISGCDEAAEVTEPVATDEPDTVSVTVEETGAPVSESKETETPEGPAFAELNISDEFRGADPEVLIEVEAEGTYPTDRLPVVKVAPKRITMEELKNWAQVLSISDEYTEPKRLSTKQEIEDRIDEIRSWMGRGSSSDRQYKEDIAFLEAAYADAPDEEQLIETDWTFHDSQYYSKTVWAIDYSEEQMDEDEKFVVDFPSVLGQGELSWSYRKKNGVYNVGLNYSVYTQMGDVSGWDTDCEHPLTLSPDEAIYKAAEVLDQLGMCDYKCVILRRYGAADGGDIMKRTLLNDTEQEAYLYNLVYRRSINGVDVLPKLGVNGPNTSEDGARYAHEQLNIWIINDEIRMINWVSPLEITEIVDTDVETIGLDEGYELFTKQMQAEYTKGKAAVKNNYEANANIKGAEIHVNEVLLGLERIQIPGNFDEFLMVPAWSCRGYVMVDRGDGCDWEHGYKTRTVLQTINAIDGTYIDVNKGY